MALVFNPFTGNFDNVMASSSDMSFSGGSLNVNGDITLDSGGTFTTTVQAVTPTANRTISFPDQTGTVGLVSGATGNIQYNNAGQLAGTGDFNIDLNWTDPLVTYTGLKVNVTDTASTAGSSILDLQSGGTSKFRFDKNGTINLPGGASYSGSTITLFSGTVETRPTGGNGYKLSYNGCAFGVLTPIFIGPSTPNINFSLGAGLYSDSQNYTIAQRNGTNAQTYRLYNTYTDASNYERGYLQWNSNVLELGTEGLGTGTARPVRITAATLNIPNLPVHADEAAATTAGLATGDVYRTSTGELRIKL